MKRSRAADAPEICITSWKRCSTPWKVRRALMKWKRYRDSGDVQEEYEHLGGYTLEAQAREVLHGLGFRDDQIDGDVGALSGGWRKCALLWLAFCLAGPTFC